MTLLGAVTIGAPVLALARSHEPPLVDAPNGQVSGAPAKQSSYIVQASSFAVALAAVKRVGGIVTHELAVIDAVAANLTPAQASALRSRRGLTLTSNASTTVLGTNLYTGIVQPYVADRTQATLLHSQGITGKGVTIAFLDTGWSNKIAVQDNTAG